MTAGLSRRRFLGIAGGAAGAALAGTAVWSRLVEDQVEDRRAAGRSRGEHLLVVLELSGGNDGLNTLVPTAGRYHDARPTVALADRDLVALAGEDRFGLHPSLAPLAPLWADGHLAAIQGVGFDDQSRSHFAATDTWRAGGQSPFTTSWLGRWLDATAGDQATPLRAVALGTNTRVLAADRSLSTVITAPANFRLMAPEGDADPAAVVRAFQATAAPLSDDPLFVGAQSAIPATLEAVDVLARATAGGDGPRTAPTGDARYGQATALFDTAARIVGLDVGVQVLVIGVDGFDTHASQLDPHRRLLADVATGLTRFLDAMEAQGRAEDVLVVTTSEFGRRVAENGSGGTDHGRGNLQLLAGAPVAGQIVGEPDLVHLVEGDLPIRIDTRSLYSVALDWLGGPTDELLGGSFDRYGLLTSG